MKSIRVTSFNDTMILTSDKITAKNAVAVAKSAIRKEKKTGAFFQAAKTPLIEVAVCGGQWHTINRKS